MESESLEPKTITMTDEEIKGFSSRINASKDLTEDDKQLIRSMLPIILFISSFFTSKKKSFKEFYTNIRKLFLNQGKTTESSKKKVKKTM